MAEVTNVYDLFVFKEAGSIKKPVNVIAYVKRSNNSTPATLANWERISLIDPFDSENATGGVWHTETDGVPNDRLGGGSANHVLINHILEYLYFVDQQYTKGDGDNNYRSFWPENITTTANLEIWANGVDPLAAVAQVDFTKASELVAVTSVNTESSAIKSGALFDAIDGWFGKEGYTDGYKIIYKADGAWGVTHKVLTEWVPLEVVIKVVPDTGAKVFTMRTKTKLKVLGSVGVPSRRSVANPAP